MTILDSNRPSRALAAPRWGVRSGRRSWLRFAVTVAAGLVVTSTVFKTVEYVGVRAIVHAPNAGRGTFAPRPGEVQVDVGPPAAVLSLAILETPDPHPLGTVFVLHGIRDSKETMRGWGDMLVGAGYRAVLVDLRGQGHSTGTFLTYGVQESADLSQVLDTLTAQKAVTGPVGVMGNSYGAATAIVWAGHDPRIKAVIAVSPFASLRAIVPAYGIVPVPASFVNRIIALAGERGGFDPDAASAVEAIGRTSAPVLLIHGRSDARIPYAHSERIHEAGADHSELVLVDGAGHETVGAAPQTRLPERTREWFGAHLRD